MKGKLWLWVGGALVVGLVLGYFFGYDVGYEKAVGEQLNQNGLGVELLK